MCVCVCMQSSKDVCVLTGFSLSLFLSLSLSLFSASTIIAEICHHAHNEIEAMCVFTVCLCAYWWLSTFMGHCMHIQTHMHTHTHTHTQTGLSTPPLVSH